MDYSKYTHITLNSKNVIKNSIFVSVDSNLKYIVEAINKGASLIITKNKLNLSVENLVVKNIVYFYTYLFKKINNLSMDDFTIIAVTGTDGKTTTAKMIYDTIDERYKAIYIGTIGIISKYEIKKTINTTPDIEIIYETLLEAKKQKIKYIIMEASSEGIKNNRLMGLRFDVIIFTNLTREHLNTHITMENYFKCKCRIINLLKKDGKIITNFEDYYMKKIATNKTINYGLNKGNVSTSSIRLFKDKTRIIIKTKGHLFYYEIPFVGIYNVYNFLATFSCIYHLFNINLFSFKNIKPVPGRFMVLSNKVVIDFAHTPNALENLLLTIKTIFNKEIILLIGSQGEKDKGKRILLGEVSNKYCDTIIVTSEDPKNEPVLEIISDITTNIINKKYYIALFRKQGIDLMLSLLTDKHIGVIVGKGLEDTEQIRNILYSHSDYFYTQKKLSEKIT